MIGNRYRPRQAASLKNN